MGNIAELFLESDGNNYKDFTYKLGKGKETVIRIFEPTAEEILNSMGQHQLYTAQGKAVPPAEIIDLIIRICHDPETGEKVFKPTMRDALLKSGKAALIRIYNDYMSMVGGKLEDYEKN